MQMEGVLKLCHDAEILGTVLGELAAELSFVPLLTLFVWNDESTDDFRTALGVGLVFWSWPGSIPTEL